MTISARSKKNNITKDISNILSPTHLNCVHDKKLQQYRNIVPVGAVVSLHLFQVSKSKNKIIEQYF